MMFIPADIYEIKLRRCLSV